MIININIDESLFPKLLEIEKDKLDSTIKFLLNIGYQNVFSFNLLIFLNYHFPCVPNGQTRYFLALDRSSSHYQSYPDP